jgi:O-antigen ligase
MILVQQWQTFNRELGRLKATLQYYFEVKRAVWLRLVLVTGVVAIAPAVGIVISIINPLYILVALSLPLALIAAQYGLPRFDLAPIVILVAAAFLPISLPTGRESQIVDSLLLTVIYLANWFLRMIILEKRLHFTPSSVNKPILYFTIITLLSLIWSLIYRDPLVVVWSNFPVVQTASAMVIVVSPGLLLLIANHVNDLRIFKVMVIIMLIAGTIGVIRPLGSIDLNLVNDGGLFTMWVVGLSVSLALFNQKLGWYWRVLLLVLAGAWIYVRFGMQITWVAGWLSTFAALGVVIFLRSWKLTLGVLVAISLVISLNADYYLGKVLEDESNESGRTRTAAWEVNWRVTGQHLFLGTGPAGYTVYYMSYFPSDGMATHNNYIDVIAQTGIFGLLTCVWFFFALAWLGYKLCLRLKGRRDFVEALANAAFAGTVGCIVIMGFGDWLFPFAYTQTIAGFDYTVYSWLFMGILLVLDRLYPPETSA